MSRKDACSKCGEVVLMATEEDRAAVVCERCRIVTPTKKKKKRAKKDETDKET